MDDIMTIGTQAYLQGYMHEKTAADRDERSRWERFKDSLTGKKPNPFYVQPGDFGGMPEFKGDPGFTDPESFRGLEDPRFKHRKEPWFKGDPGFNRAPGDFGGRPEFKGDPGFTMPSEEKPTLGGKISSLYEDILRKAYEIHKRRREKRFRKHTRHLAPDQLPTPGELR